MLTLYCHSYSPQPPYNLNYLAAPFMTGAPAASVSETAEGSCMFLFSSVSEMVEGIHLSYVTLRSRLILSLRVLVE
jgi:hypothetical protein